MFLNSLYGVKAGDICEKDFPSVPSKLTVSEVKRFMERKKVVALPVFEGKNLKGIIDYLDILRFFKRGSMKIGRIVSPRAPFEPEDDLVSLSQKYIASGEPALCSESGLITEKTIAKALYRVKELEVSIKELKPGKTPLVKGSTDIATALNLMPKQGVLGIIDEEGSIEGFVGAFEIVVIPPRKRMTANSRVGEKVSVTDVPLEEVIQFKRLFVDEKSTVRELLEKIVEADTTAAVIRAPNPYIITLRDIIKYVARMRPVTAPVIQTVGIDTPEEKEMVVGKVSKAVSGPLRRYGIDEAIVHCKKHSKQGTTHRYNVKLRMNIGLDAHAVEAEGWDLPSVVDEAIDEMERYLSNLMRRR